MGIPAVLVSMTLLEVLHEPAFEPGILSFVLHVDLGVRGLVVQWLQEEAGLLYFQVFIGHILICILRYNQVSLVIPVLHMWNTKYQNEYSSYEKHQELTKTLGSSVGGMSLSKMVWDSSAFFWKSKINIFRIDPKMHNCQSWEDSNLWNWMTLLPPLI